MDIRIQLGEMLIIEYFLEGNVGLFIKNFKVYFFDLVIILIIYLIGIYLIIIFGCIDRYGERQIDDRRYRQVGIY